MYRCEATSVEGFVQQLSVSYIARGYWFYVAGSVPETKDPREIDQKIIEKYEIDISKWTRLRRKRLGVAGIQYLRFERFFLVLAGHGKHRFFSEELGIRDVRRTPIRFAGYSIAYRPGSDGKGHPSVRIDQTEFQLLKQTFFAAAVNASVETISTMISQLHFAPYAPIRTQYRQLLRNINKRRREASLEVVSAEALPKLRRVVSAFSMPGTRFNNITIYGSTDEEENVLCIQETGISRTRRGLA